MIIIKKLFVFLFDELDLQLNGEKSILNVGRCYVILQNIASSL